MANQIAYFRAAHQIIRRGLSVSIQGVDSLVSVVSNVSKAGPEFIYARIQALFDNRCKKQGCVDMTVYHMGIDTYPNHNRQSTS